MNPLNGVIAQIHSLVAKFFWGGTGGLKCKHLVKWKALCLPKKEGGLGLRSLFDVNSDLFAKLWWIFRISTSSL